MTLERNSVLLHTKKQVNSIKRAAGSGIGWCLPALLMISLWVGTSASGCSRIAAIFADDDQKPSSKTDSEQQQNEPGDKPKHPHPRAQVASFDKPVSLFGDLPMRAAAEYAARAATSLTQHTFAEDGVDSDPKISRDGEFMVFASTRHHNNPDIYRKNIDGVAITQITGDPAADVQPAISPDASRIAFASNRTGNWDIWIVELDGRRPVQVTSGPQDEVHPSWSPDGQRLIYCSLAPHGQWELWVVDAIAGGKRKFVGYGLFPEWAPDGDTILYQRARERGSRWFSIWTMELVDDEPLYPTEIASSPDYSLIAPSWSHTGEKVAFGAIAKTQGAATDATVEQADILIVNRDGTGRIPLTDGFSANFSPAWSPDGRLFFTSRRGGAESIWSLRPPNSNPSPDFTQQSEERPGVILTGGG